MRNGQCNGTGDCALFPMGTACGQPGCSGGTIVPAPRCDGAGTCVNRPPQSCAGGLVCESATSCKTRCASPADCVGGLPCDAATGLCQSSPKKIDGERCDPAAGGGDCASGFCMDGVCCESGCRGLCRACSSSKTGRRDGICAPISGGTDPDGECGRQDPTTCGRDGNCDGGGACRQYPRDTPCGSYCCSQNSTERRCRLACTGDGQCNLQTDNVVQSCDDGIVCTEDKCQALSGTETRCTYASQCSGNRCCCVSINACVTNAALCPVAVCNP